MIILRTGAVLFPLEEGDELVLLPRSVCCTEEGNVSAVGVILEGVEGFTAATTLDEEEDEEEKELLLLGLVTAESKRGEEGLAVVGAMDKEDDVVGGPGGPGGGGWEEHSSSELTPELRMPPTAL